MRIKSITCLLVSCLFYSSTEKIDTTWQDLLDQDMAQWRTYLSYAHRPGYNGKIPKDESGNEIAPIGYDNDTHGVFTMTKQGSQHVLRVSGEIYGCVFTKQEFENYHFRAQVMWGAKKYVPRTEKLKDSGILYHSIGEAGAEYWRTWMLSQEFQIMEGHMGDYWSQATSAIDIRAYLPEGRMNSIASPTQPFLSFGTGSTENYCMRSENHESPAGEWTTLELICYEDKSLHIVNGKVVMILQNSRYEKDGGFHPLTKGRIQLQSEAAEVFFRDIRIRKISGIPAKYQRLFE